jgi:two-component sensor histidine kinase/CHASE1-domain containing sensor protein
MRGSGQRGSGIKLVAGVLGVAVAYALTGALSWVAMPRGYPPAVWAPAGVAIVAVLLGGRRLAPAVALGAFVVHLLTFHGGSLGASLVVAAVLAGGAALQALVGAFLVRRFVAAPAALDEARDVGMFLLLAGPVASTVGASIATLTLLGAGVIGTADLWLRWSTWWLGESAGALLVAPLLVAWRPQPRQMPGRRLWVTVPVVLAGALVMVLFVRASRWEQSRLDATLRRRADAVTAALERGSDHYLHVVQSIADFHNAVGHVERAPFQLYVTGALARDPGILALAWVPSIADTERADKEAGARREGQERFEFKDWGPTPGELRRAADRPEYYPLLYLEPERENESLLGLDLASSPRWRAELEQAEHTGQPGAGIDQTLLGKGPPTFVVVVPVFPGGPPSVFSGEPLAPAGFAVGICSLKALADTALRVDGRGLDLTLHELAVPGGSSAVYHHPHPEVNDPEGVLGIPTNPRIAGRTWAMTLLAGLRDQAAERSWQPWLVLTSGILFVAWLEAFLLIITGRTSKVELMVAQRTRELQVSNRAVEEQRAELTRSNAELAAALNAKEILLRELHHRVKNNLQVIASLFSLQARYLPDARSKEIFEESRNRVFSIALAHEKLYRSKDLGRIDFSEYARNLIGHLHSMFGTGSGVSLVTEIHEMTLPVETAIPCGLVINELVTNAFKHAFPAGRRGAIRVVLRELDSSQWMMAVEDDGVGLPAGIALGKADSLGLDLVSILAAQIGAEVELRREGGTSFRMTFGARRRPDA